ncbi:F1142-like protein [Mya arenaria]|uniref:F1142-like protein n=1 Tax=Mya arenaria TaxID=6604 RepID=A0ABY7DLD0_MYAAR|nr:F1142-like protein [Mya arenaria]
MSDSEEEFASADEGDMEAKSGAASKQSHVKETVNQTEKAGVEKDTVKTKSSKKGSEKTHTKHNQDTASKSPEGEGPLQKTKSQSKPTSGGKGKKGKQKSKGKVQKQEKETSDETDPTQASANVEKEDEGASSISKATNLSDVNSEKKDSSDGKIELNNSQVIDSEGATSCVFESDSNTDSTSAITHEKPAGTQLSEKLVSEETLVGEGASKKELTAEELEEKANMIKSPSSQSISRPPPDHTDKEEAVLQKLAGAAAEKKGGWGWGWGSSLLEVASSSVSTFTKEVGEGLHTMMETVESTLNVPDPEELVRGKKEGGDADTSEKGKQDTETSEKTISKENEKPKEVTQSDNQSEKAENQSPEAEADNQSAESSNQSTKTRNQNKSEEAEGWFSSWGVSNISKMVENTSKNLVTGSLDVLENIGKKTFDAINERDPGLKKTRHFLLDRGDKPNLSASLREAKEQEEVRAQHEKESEEARKAHFGSLFDEFQGLAHLEALEMLSNQCEKSVNALLGSLSPDTLGSIKPTLVQVRANCEVGEDEEEDVEEQDFEVLVKGYVRDLKIGATPDKLIKELHRAAISGLAEFTSKSIEQFHKAGELILLDRRELSDFVVASETLQRLTKVLCAEEKTDEIKISHLVTNIYLEASNSSSYIQDGFQLLLPVLQQATIESSQEQDS